MGHRVSAGGTDDDWKRFIQRSFDYCWRYYKWTFSLKSATITVDVNDKALLPTDFDHEGWRQFDGVTEVTLEDTLSTTNSGSAIVWDWDESRYALSPAVAGSVVYQITPPTLTTDTGVPFPSAQVVALGATVYAKQGENPTRADIQQEWDLLHSELDRLVGRADSARAGTRTPQNRHDLTGTHTGQV